MASYTDMYRGQQSRTGQWPTRSFQPLNKSNYGTGNAINGQSYFPQVPGAARDINGNQINGNKINKSQYRPNTTQISGGPQPAIGKVKAPNQARAGEGIRYIPERAPGVNMDQWWGRGSGQYDVGQNMGRNIPTNTGQRPWMPTSVADERSINLENLTVERDRILNDIMQKADSQYNIFDVQKLTNQINDMLGRGPNNSEAINPDRLAGIKGQLPDGVNGSSAKPQGADRKSQQQQAQQQTTIPGPVTLDYLYQLANQQQGNTDIEVAPERFQTPEQLSATVAQIMGMLDPYTKSQQQQAQSAYQAQMQRLQGDWASRGLLASGGASAQERQGAVDIASQLAAIQAQAQANAIPLAMQYGQMGMQEAMNRWQQQDANRQFNNQLSQQRLQNISDVWQRQFDVTQFDWQKEEAKLQRALQARGISAQASAASAQNAIARAQMDMQNKQMAMEQALQEASLTGYYNGNPTMAYQNQAWQQLLDIANQTGQLYLPGGIPTTSMPATR